MSPVFFDYIRLSGIMLEIVPRLHLKNPAVFHTPLLSRDLVDQIYAYLERTCFRHWLAYSILKKQTKGKSKEVQEILQGRPRSDRGLKRGQL